MFNSMVERDLTNKFIKFEFCILEYSTGAESYHVLSLVKMIVDSPKRHVSVVFS